MEFYQADILEEDVVTSWGTRTHVSKKYVEKKTSTKVRKASESFLKVNIDTVQAVLFSLRAMMTRMIKRPCSLRGFLICIM
jgi:eIF4-gamma/eIF5/eIF2-epsilon